MKCFRFLQKITWKHLCIKNLETFSHKKTGKFSYKKPGNIDEKDDGRCEEQCCHTEREKSLKVCKIFQDFLLFLKLEPALNVQLTMVPTSPPIAKNAMLQRETKVPPMA